MKFRRLNHLMMAKVNKLMLEGGRTLQEISEETGLHYCTVGRYVNAMRQEGIAYIEDWEEDSIGRRMKMVPRLGVGKDKPRPPALTIAERQARSRRKRAALAAQMQVINALAGQRSRSASSAALTE